jgi:hypothetical protein
LEIYRDLCIGKQAPLEALCSQFNQETHNGEDVKRSTDMLENPVASIEKTFKKRAVGNLFDDRRAVLVEKAKQISKSTDFDLITWLIIC